MEIAELRDALRHIHADICSETIAPKRDVSKVRPFVLSVATYAPRFSSIAKVFRALQNQDVLPVETHIWIPREDAPEGLASLPHDALAAFSEWGGVSLHWVDEDLGPHNKYYHLLGRGVELPVLTIDDDAILSSGHFRALWEAHLRFPDCVVAGRTHRIGVQEDSGRFSLLPYAEWGLEQSAIVNKPSHALLPTGLGGIMYPPNVLPSYTFDSASIVSTCLYGDDLWLKTMELIADVRVVDCGCGFTQNLVDGSQACALANENLSNNRNDEYLRLILEFVESASLIELTSEELIRKIACDVAGERDGYETR